MLQQVTDLPIAMDNGAADDAETDQGQEFLESKQPGGARLRQEQEDRQGAKYEYTGIKQASRFPVHDVQKVRRNEQRGQAQEFAPRDDGYDG